LASVHLTIQRRSFQLDEGFLVAVAAPGSLVEPQQLVWAVSSQLGEKKTLAKAEAFQ